MNKFGILLPLFLAFHGLLGLPAHSNAPSSLNSLSKNENIHVREKRDPDPVPVDALPKATASNADSAVPTIADVSSLPDSQLVDPSNHEANLEEIKRDKKQAACVKLNSCGKTACGPLISPETTPEQPQADTIVLQRMHPIDEQHLAYAQGARTIEPLYSLGPLSLSADAGALGAYAAQPITSQSALQLHAVLPYTMHQHAHIHPGGLGLGVHQNLGYSRQPNVYYYNAPEPLYVPTIEHNSAAQASPSPVSLYCHSLKSGVSSATVGQDKQLPASSAASASENNTNDEQIQAHIERVNQIRDEITQLNTAAQRIVEQQEMLARMQQDHMAKAAGMRSMEPLMRYHEGQMRMGMMGPYDYMPGYANPMMYQRPYYKGMSTGSSSSAAAASSASGSGIAVKSAEEQPAVQKPVEKASAAETPKEPKTESITEELKTNQPVSSESMMRQMYQGYPPYDYYNYQPMYRSETGFPAPPMYRSETGFPVPPMMYTSRANAASFPTSQEDIELFLKMLNLGKKMGVLSSDVKKTEEKEEGEKMKDENAFHDLIYGGAAKNKPIGEEEEKKEPAKRDLQGLVMKTKI